METEAVSDLFMPAIPAVVAIATQEGPNRHCGKTADRGTTVSPLCWSISPAAMVLSFRDHGRVLHDQAIYGVKPEGKLSVTYDKQTFSFPDGETYELCKPNYTITEWYKDSIAPEDLFCTVRIPLRHVGMGQMMAIDRREIEALAAKSNYPEYGISGRCNYITEKGVTGVGLSGNKAQHLDLTVELGFSSDMGVTNSRYPEEICEGQAQINQGSMMGLSYDQLDISTADMEDVDLYMQSLGVPARGNINDPQVILENKSFTKRNATSLRCIRKRVVPHCSTAHVCHGSADRPYILILISYCMTWGRRSWGSG